MKLKKKKNKFPSIELELSLFDSGYDIVIGIDEAGRGSWAGPMAIGAYIMLKDNLEVITQVKDSKLLSESQREKIFEQLNKDLYSFVLIPSRVIDEIGLTASFKKGLSSLLDPLIKKYDKKKIKVLVDGNYVLKLDHDISSIIDGDMMHYSISLASIVAKVSRDRLMYKLHELFPEYLFSNNKGYGTAKHLESIKEYGVCPFHRLSYKPIKKLNNMLEGLPKREINRYNCKV